MEEVEFMENAFNQHLLDRGEYGKGDLDFHFHPSQLKCLRQSFRSKMGMVRFNLESLGNMKVGTIFHHHIQNVVLKDIEAEHEVSVRSGKYVDIVLVGSVDSIIPPRIGIPYDYKSCKFHPRFPYDGHIEQLNAYLGILKRSHGYLVYVRKDNFSRRYFKIDFDMERFRDTILKANVVYAATKDWKEGDEIPFKKCEDKCYFCENEL